MPRLRKPAQSYHHGNLRQALLDDALRFVEQHGVEALSLRELARRLGVSSAALYHHFFDRASLLRALAEQGFAAMLEAMERELAGAGAAPNDRLFALGRGYLRFAVAHPGHFRLMFLSEAAPHKPDSAAPEIAAGSASGSATFDLLLGRVADCLRSAGRSESELIPAALAMWSGVHGLAALYLDGSLGPLVAAGGFDTIRDQMLLILGNAVNAPEPKPRRSRQTTR